MRYEEMNTNERKRLLEAIKGCKSLLNEKKLQESDFKSIIQPGLDMLNAIQKAQQSGLDLPPLDDSEDIQISKILNTSEEQLNLDGTKNESYYRTHSRLLNEDMRKPRDLLRDYVMQGGTDSWDEWSMWIARQPEAERGKRLPKGWFKSTIAGMNTSTGSVQNAEPYKPSEELQNLLDVTGAGDQNYVASALETVTDKYNTIDLILRRVVCGTNPRRYYLLAGDAGIGKTYIVNQILKEEGKLDSTVSLTGSIGKSTTNIALFLWQYRDAELLILDDCDAFLRKGGNDEVLGILKGAMEPGTKYHVHIPQTMAGRVTNALKGVKLESQNKTGIQKLFEDESDIEDDIKAIEDVLETDNEDTPDEIVPTDWTFNARLIIISNLHESQVDPALWSRCDHFDLHLTQEEYLIRLGMIIDHMDCGQDEGFFTDEEVREAKALLMSVLKPVIEAGNHGVKMFGRSFQLKQSLEFRLVKDLVIMYIAMVQDQLRLHPDKDINVIKKDVIKPWVRIGVIPRVSVQRAF